MCACAFSAVGEQGLRCIDCCRKWNLMFHSTSPSWMASPPTVKAMKGGGGVWQDGRKGFDTGEVTTSREHGRVREGKTERNNTSGSVLGAETKHCLPSRLLLRTNSDSLALWKIQQTLNCLSRPVVLYHDMST